MSANGTDSGLEILPIAGRIGAEIGVCGYRASWDLRRSNRFGRRCSNTK